MRPRVFEFSDYRQFLKNFLEYKKATKANYTMSQFIRAAGLQENSRGFFRLVVEGKRNLTSQTIARFAQAMSLDDKETAFFDSLVNFNQAKELRDREFFLARMNNLRHGKVNSQIELMASQYRYYSNWYFVAIRELVALKDFREDISWITGRLNNKVSKADAQQALADLESLGMIVRDESGRFRQSEALVKRPEHFTRELMDRFHFQMIERGKEIALAEDKDRWRMTSVTLSCPESRLTKIAEEIAKFKDLIVTKFGEEDPTADAVIQLNFQLFYLTGPQSKKETRS